MMKVQLKYIVLLLMCGIGLVASSQNINDLRHRINRIAAEKEASVGIFIMGYDGGDTLSVNGRQEFVMQSVFKLPVALTVMHFVDQSELNLSQKITLTRSDLIPGTYSPVRDRYPEGVTLSLSELIYYSLALSDNIATDILIDLVGGTGAVENYMKECGVEDISVKYNEADMHLNRENQYENHITPESANLMLQLFYENRSRFLSKSSHKFLWDTMKSTPTGEKSIRGLLPAETVIAHKTGQSGTNSDGVTAAVNDMGVVFLSGSKYFYISVFVGNSKEDIATSQEIIARISKLAWDYFSFKYN